MGICSKGKSEWKSQLKSLHLSESAACMTSQNMPGQREKANASINTLDMNLINPGRSWGWVFGDDLSVQMACAHGSRAHQQKDLETGGFFYYQTVALFPNNMHFCKRGVAVCS